MLPDDTSTPKVPFVARYPVDVWESEKRPFFDEDSWIKFAKKIAEKDLDNLAPLFNICEDVEAQNLKKVKKAERKANVNKDDT